MTARSPDPGLAVRLGRLLRRDRPLQAGLVLALVTAGVHQLPAGPREPFELLCLALFAACLLVGLRLGLGRVRGEAERGFWNDFTAAMVTLLVIPPVLIVGGRIAPDSAVPVLALRLLVTLVYTTLLLAVERQPHRRGFWRPVELERRLSLPSVIGLTLGLLVYFSFLPAATRRDLVALDEPSSALYAVLALVLAVRLLYLAWRTEDRRWRAIYTALAVMSVLSVVHHLRTVPPFGRWLLADVPLPIPFWLLPVSATLLAVRLRHLDFPRPEDPAEDPEEDPLAQGGTGLETFTLLVALGIPVLHFLGYRLGLLEEAYRRSRELWMLPWIAFLGGVAFVQHRRLGRRMSRALDERRRIERILAHNERGLRLAEERRKSDEALFFSREKFAKAFRASPYAMAITTLAEGRHLEVNDRYLEILGYSEADLIGRTVADIGLWAQPEQRDELAARVMRDGAVREFEFRFRRSDGEVRDALVSVELLEVEGERCILSISRDVTAEVEERRRARACADLLDHATEAVVVLDLEQGVTYWNGAAQALLGPTPEQAEAAGAEEVLFAADPAAWERARRRTLEQGHWTGRLAAPRRDGGRLALDCRWTLVHDDAGVPSAWLVVFRPG